MATTGTTSARAVHGSLAAEILDELNRRDPDGSILADASADDLQTLAALAVDRVLDASRYWVEALGPFFDTEGVRTLLGADGHPVSRQAVHKRRGLLALTTGSGQIVYPAGQFRDRHPAPGLADILDALHPDLVSRWTVASWLFAPEAELAGARPVDVLFEGVEGRAAVLDVAHHWAEQLRA